MEPAIGKVHHQRLLNGTFLFAVAALLGYLGWVLPEVGGSLAIPTLIVFGIGCAIAFGWWIGFRDWPVVASVVAITIGASTWAFAFSIPASVTWGSRATVQAQSALSRIGSSPDHAYTAKCLAFETGGVGPIGAPYRQCTGANPLGADYVIFTAAHQTTRGLAYTDGGAAMFGNECSRHLVGKWWMFTSETDGTGDCPIGYKFHGGA